MKNKTLWSSIKCAAVGLKDAYIEEKNMKIHFFIALITIVAGISCNLSVNEWLWALLAIFLVIVMEILNTALENLVDLVTEKRFEPLAKKVKDTSAGAVLFMTLFAILVGMILFLPRLILIVKFIFL